MALDYRFVVAQQSAGLLKVLKAVQGGEVDGRTLDSPVSGCPEWSISDLGFHLAGVQTWAAAVVRAGEVVDHGSLVAPSADVTVALATATEDLLAALDAADLEAPCWNFCADAPQTQAFWPRRQALEVAVHRWDAEFVVSDAPSRIEPELAADVIDEYLRLLLPRSAERDGIDSAALEGHVVLRCIDVPAAGWVVGVSDDNKIGVVSAPGSADSPGAGSTEGHPAAATVSGQANELALFLYGRLPSTSVELSGDTSVLSTWKTVFDF